MKLLEPQQDNIESPIEENISNEVDDLDRQYEDISQNSNESTKLEEELLPADSTSPGEKRELNRTYELEKELVEIRQQITDVEYNDN